MIGSLIARLGFGGIALKGWATLATAAAALAVGTWLATTLYLAGVHAERVKTLEDQISQIKADLIANEVIRRQAEADARAAEEEEKKLKELVDALRDHKSCPLTREHVDGVHRIDGSP